MKRPHWLNKNEWDAVQDYREVMHEDEEGRNKALLDAIREDTEMEADDEPWYGESDDDPILYDGKVIPKDLSEVSTSILKDWVFRYEDPINAHPDNCTCLFCEELIRRDERF